MRMAKCETQFAMAAARDGIHLTRSTEPWLNQQGHLGLPATAEEARRVLGFIFAALGGQSHQLASRRPTALVGDFRHAPSGTLIEVDTWQHFTTLRLATLNMYPLQVPLGFDSAEYQALCRQWAGRSDYMGKTPVVGFGYAGRQRQRAYHDALRDLAAPAMRRPPVMRVPAAEGDGEAAYNRVRDQLVALEEANPASDESPGGSI